MNQISNNYSHENKPLFSAPCSSRCLCTSTQHWANFASRQAQTFTGQAKLTQSPPRGFQALIYAVAVRPGRIRVNFDNESRGPVRIQVRDQQGNMVYDEFESSVHYRGYVNLLSAPTGDYTVSLSKPQGVYSQTFRIEPSTPGHIVLLNDGPATESPKPEKLIASH